MEGEMKENKGGGAKTSKRLFLEEGVVFVFETGSLSHCSPEWPSTCELMLGLEVRHYIRQTF